MKVTWRLWWRMSRLANSIIGIRWPIPGEGIMATIAPLAPPPTSFNCSSMAVIVVD